MLSNTKELMIWVYYTYNRWSEPHFFVSFPCCATTQIYILDNHLMDCSLPKSKSSWHENFTDRFHGTIVTWPCPRPRGIQTQVSQSHSSKMDPLIFRLIFFSSKMKLGLIFHKLHNYKTGSITEMVFFHDWPLRQRNTLIGR